MSDSTDAIVPVDEYDVALLDLDGVVYRGPNAVPHAVEALDAARARGMGLAFVTNNAARTPDAVAAHLNELGVTAEPSDVVTSAQAAARLLADQVPAGSAVLVVGGEGLFEALRERGLKPVTSADGEPVAVVHGYGPEVGSKHLAEACYAIHAGASYIATNTDMTIPTDRGIGPGNGAMVRIVQEISGVTPQVAGKPELPLHRETILRTGASKPLVVGDRLDTDIEGAVKGGVDSLLVLTGVADAAQVVAAPAEQRPTFVAEDLRALLEPLPGMAASSGGWTASVADGTVRLEGEGSKIDGLRAVCAAAWGADSSDASEALRQLGY